MPALMGGRATRSACDRAGRSRCDRIDFAGGIGAISDRSGPIEFRFSVTSTYTYLEPNLSESLAEIGQDPGWVLGRARSEAIGALYEAATQQACERGVFGAPSFVVDGEPFWGDDRLEDALGWRRRAG